MDVVELREQLIHTNTSFATEISDYQETISNGLNKILNIIAREEEKEFQPSNYIEVSLIPPVVLILQLIEMTLSSIGNIGGVFQQMQLQFDPYQFLKKYVPYIDWDDFKESSDKYIREQNTKLKLREKSDAEEGGDQSVGPGGGGF